MLTLLKRSLTPPNELNRELGWQSVSAVSLQAGMDIKNQNIELFSATQKVHKKKSWRNREERVNNVRVWDAWMSEISRRVKLP